eukprot:TRINITY_DN6059_c0_g1_i4.p1 TRINITY_DN6059_c0_g1~~TRINITY_DN6059_c0_g1_i4.p1  ORF type:complete len:294 (+),score=50.54 TRINITY_DN6059_c0_g1_i4:166-1047(+)
MASSSASNCTFNSLGSAAFLDGADTNKEAQRGLGSRSASFTGGDRLSSFMPVFSTTKFLRGAINSRSSSSAEGDAQVQQMLVDMLRVQMGKSRVVDFLDERSQYMRNIARDSNNEFNAIAIRTMKGVDAVGTRLLREIDADALAIERDLRIARKEIEAEQRKFEEFERRMYYTRNEGLFFKNLYSYDSQPRRSSGLNEAPVVAVEVAPAPTKKAGSATYRQILYAGLSLVLVSFIWSSSAAFFSGTCMRVPKLAAYGVVFSFFLLQLKYEDLLTGEEEEEENRASDSHPGREN